MTEQYDKQELLNQRRLLGKRMLTYLERYNNMNVQDDFVILHHAKDNKPVMINRREVEQCVYSEEHNGTMIMFVFSDNPIVVKESVERIYNIFTGRYRKDKGSEAPANQNPEILKS